MIDSRNGFRRGLFLTLIGVLVCGCPLEEQVSVGGAAQIGFALHGGSVTLADSTGVLPGTEGVTDTQGNWGAFSVFQGTEDLRVEIRDGSLNEFPFDGVLSACVPREAMLLNESENLASLPVTIRSTCVERYMRFAQVDYETALSVVAAFFEIPEDQPLLALDLDPAYFDPFVFLDMAEKEGGFDAYVDALLLRMGGSETEPMGSDSENSVDVKDMSLSSFVSYQMFWGMVGKIGTLALPYVLSSMGIAESFEESVRNQLEEILGEMRQMRQDIEHISTRVDWTLDALQVTQDDVLRQILESELRPHITIINTQFDQFMLVDPENPAAAAAFADGFGYDLDQEIMDIHGIITDSPSANVLMYLSNFLSNEVHAQGGTGAALLDNYQTLEDYFSKLLGVEMKALFLQMNLLDYDQRRGGTKNFTGSAEDFAIKVRSKIEQQVDYFLLAVERLAVSTADVRTVVAGRYSMFPEEAVETVFRRADFLAAQFSERHQAPLVMRVIGDLDTVVRCIDAPPIEAPHFGTPAVMRLPEWGGSMREYTPYFPTNYNTRAYLTWTLGSTSGEYEFQMRDKVAVAKLVFPNQTIPFTDAHRRNAPYSRNYTFMPEQIEGTVRYSLRNPGSGVESSANEESDVFMGHGTYFARHNPRFYSIGRFGGYSSRFYNIRTESKPASGLLKNYYELLRGYDGDADQAYAYETWCRLVNDTGRAQNLVVTCDAHSSAQAIGFENAAFPTSPDTVHHLYLKFQWKLLFDDTPALSYSADTSGLAINYDRYVERSLQDQVTQRWTSGQARELRHQVTRDEISAYSWAAFRDRSDRGSKAIFEHRLNALEILPQ